MRRIFILLIIIFTLSSLYAQNDYRWYKGQKLFLKIIPNKKFILFESIKDTIALKEELNLPNAKIFNFSETHIRGNIKPFKSVIINEKKWAVIEDVGIPYLKFAENNNVLYESNYYYTSNKIEVGLSHLFYVKLKSPADINILVELAIKNKVEILGSNKFMPLWYTLSCSKESNGNALGMANLFYETGFFAASEPDLMCNDLPQCQNDTYFNDQWNLNNTGQYNGTEGIDINLCQVRPLTTGDQDIVVALIDEGSEMNHPDLTNWDNQSFDTESGTSPSQVLGMHGTACAGIIGASINNNLGISGIAPGCPLMDISNSMAGTPNSRQRRADGINFAWQNGASVISNSWFSGVQYQVIDDAINAALMWGRDGLGCVVVFAAGNDNAAVQYPANSNPDILAVGAMSECGERKSPNSCDGEGTWGSNFGAELDVIAPGVLIPTTDQQDLNGYNPSIPIHPNNGGTLVTNDYNDQDFTIWFNGTSAACPHVSSTAALMLSANPNLTQRQVANIIESTANKVGGYNYQNTPGRPNGTWHQEAGYGLLDAYCAVIHSFPWTLWDWELTTGTYSHYIINMLYNVTIHSGSIVNINTGELTICGPFEAKLGSVLNIQYSGNFTCN